MKYHVSQMTEFQPEIADSLLENLCGKECKGEPNYTTICAYEPEGKHCTRKDFPFFGDRLLALQDVVVKSPSNLKIT
jgi:hypothetical protein